MNFINLFETVESEFSRDIAILVVSAVTINLSEKVKKKDLKTGGLFTQRINGKLRQLLWEHPPETIDLVIEIRDAIHEFQTRKSMVGLGGCQVLTLKEIIKINKEKP